MAIINYREIKHRYDLDGAKKTCAHFTEALMSGDLKANDFSVRDLAEGLVPDGREWVRQLDPRQQTSLVESDAVDVSAFKNITGQIIYSKIMEKYLNPAFSLSAAVETVPTRLDGEKIPGIGKITEDAMVVQPGMPYPRAGFSEDYVETPSTTKRGLIVPVTKEAIFFDRTNLVLSRAAEVGEVLGMNKEKRIADVMLGVTNNYKWKGTSYNTFYASSDNQSWANKLTSNELVDWTDVDAAEQLFAAMSDPDTGDPIILGGTSVLVMPAYRHAANRVFNATSIEYTASGSPTKTIAGNPIASNYTLMESVIAYRRLIANSVAAADAKKYWMVGDFKKAFAYMENWPLTVTQAAANSEAEFNQDIVAQFKASERGVAAVMNPRYAVLCTG